MRNVLKRKKRLPRSAAMEARPYPMPGIRAQEEADGELKILRRFERSNWQKWLGAPPEYERHFLLDPLGREVFEACSGKATVKKIVERFAVAHSLSITEAEMAVTKYLKTLMMKGIVGMAVGTGEGPATESQEREE